MALQLQSLIKGWIRRKLFTGSFLLCLLIVIIFPCRFFNFFFEFLSIRSLPGELEYMDLDLNLYHSRDIFKLNYEEMEKKFKVFVYPRDDMMPTKLRKYVSEWDFFKNLRKSRFITYDPNRAHLFFIPTSTKQLLCRTDSQIKGQYCESISTDIEDHVKSLITRYPYWNRTLGADHFFVSCRFTGLANQTSLLKNVIKVECASSYERDFVPHKDVAFPQLRLQFSYQVGGYDLENRTILGYWAGRRNSNVRDALSAMWQNDKELDIQNRRLNQSGGHHHNKFYTAKYCICPRSSHDNNLFIADAIHYACVPVILSDYYNLPFNDILDWGKFSVILKESDVPQLKHILQNISAKDFIALHNNLVKVQRHFKWNYPPIRYDAFHMVMYELWIRHHVTRY